MMAQDAEGHPPEEYPIANKEVPMMKGLRVPDLGVGHSLFDIQYSLFRSFLPFPAKPAVAAAGKFG